MDGQEQLIQTLPEENLYILTAGEMPPNPAQLLSSGKMKELLLQFQTQFDLVIVDTPPLHGFADAKYLANQVDGLVMVVGLDKTEKPAVRQVLNDLNLSHINLLGIVANGAKDYTTSYANYTKVITVMLKGKVRKRRVYNISFSPKLGKRRSNNLGALCHAEVRSILESCHPEIRSILESCHLEVRSILESCHPEIQSI